MGYDEYDSKSPAVQRWADLYQCVADTLSEFGKEDSFVEGDYLIHDEYWGYPQVKIYLHDLSFLNTPLVAKLKQLLESFPGHEVIVAIAVRGGEHWPDMGLTIRGHEIIDGLQREYFPPELRSVAFEGGRPGNEHD